MKDDTFTIEWGKDLQAIYNIPSMKSKGMRLVKMEGNTMKDRSHHNLYDYNITRWWKASKVYSMIYTIYTSYRDMSS